MEKIDTLTLKSIRTSVFETNSSSTHSISISNGDPVWDTIYPVDGEIRIFRGEFGWGPTTHNDPLTKASYIWTDGQTEYVEWLSQAIEEMTGIKPIFEDNEGYIDHESYGILDFSTYEELYMWVFDKNSWLNILNDNSYSIIDETHPTYNPDGTVTPHEFKYHYAPLDIRYDTHRQLENLIYEKTNEWVRVKDGKLEFRNGVIVEL